MSKLVQLPTELLVKILSHLDFTTLSKLCSSSVELRDFCQSGVFWKSKFYDELQIPLTFESNEHKYAPEIFLEAKRQHLNNIITKIYDKREKLIIDVLSEIIPNYKNLPKEFTAAILRIINYSHVEDNYLEFQEAFENYEIDDLKAELPLIYAKLQKLVWPSEQELMDIYQQVNTIYDLLDRLDQSRES